MLVSRLPWLLVTLMLSTALSALNIFALAGHWYWTYRWFDTPMHMLGGATSAAFIVALAGRFRPFLFLAAIAAVAIGWEIFEWQFGLSREQPNYVFDTLHDILNDVIGAALIYTLARYTLWRSA
ncbi:MAG: putative rane protein [Parcubacteria group bacterium]|nr:putative rane protein [Parcubacteria group bacterium]